MSEDEDAIAQYRRELTAAADVARGDADEIEDHLRCLTDELRARGLPASEAVAEAARRLGDPRAIGREHARVRGAFGAPLPWPRAFSAAVLLLVPFALTLARPHRHSPFDPIPAIEQALYAIVLVGFVARRSWARAALLGMLPLGLMSTVTMTAAGVVPVATAIHTLWYAGALVFLVPWRRRELTAAGVAVALLANTYGMATLLFDEHVTGQTGSPADQIVAAVALACMLGAAAGVVMRARWAAIAAVGIAVALAIAGVGLAHDSVRMSSPVATTAQNMFSLTACIASALVGAALLWRTGRSRLGSLRHVAR